MDPVTNKLLQGTPYAGMGGTQERNALIGVIRNLISEDKYTVDYILNYAQSVGYQRQMAEEVFKELTGLSPKLIVNNNEYYNMPSYVPNMCIAWGTSKSNKEKAFYIVPFEYGYAVMEKDEVNAPIPTVISATIPEAFEELKKVAKGIQTLDKIITKKLLETEDVQTDAHTVHQVNLPYAASPLQILKKNFKDKVLSVSEFERQASKLLASEEITVDEAEDLMAWKQDLIDEDETYGNDVLELDEQWKPLDAEVDDDDFNGYHSSEEYLNSYEHLYETLVTGNIDLYKEKLNKLSKSELMDYIAWAEEMGIGREELKLHYITASKKQSGIVPTEKITLEDGRTFTVRYNPNEKSITTVLDENGKETRVDTGTRLQLLRKLFHKGEPTIVNKSASKKQSSSKEDFDAEVDNIDNLISYYSTRLNEFIDDYYGDNAAMQSEVDYDFLNKHSKELFNAWKEELLNNTNADEWSAAEKAYYDLYDGRKTASKKVTSFLTMTVSSDEFSDIWNNARECGDEIWSIKDGKLLHIIGYNDLGDTVKITYEPVDDFELWEECKDDIPFDFSILEYLPEEGILKDSSKKVLSESVSVKDLEQRAKHYEDLLKEEGYTDMKVTPNFAYGQYGYYFDWTRADGKSGQKYTGLGTKKETLKNLELAYYELVNKIDWFMKRKSANSNLNDSIKEWYTKTYKTDECGADINPNTTFMEVLSDAENAYDLIGVTDSVVRERVFDELSKRTNIPYEKIFNMWMGKQASKISDDIKERLTFGYFSPEQEKSLPNFNSTEELESYIKQTNSFPDNFFYKGGLFTMDEYDMSGSTISYSSPEIDMGLEINTTDNRYDHKGDYKNMEISIDEENGPLYRTDITYYIPKSVFDSIYGNKTASKKKASKKVTAKNLVDNKFYLEMNNLDEEQDSELLNVLQKFYDIAGFVPPLWDKDIDWYLLSHNLQIAYEKNGGSVSNFKGYTSADDKLLTKELLQSLYPNNSSELINLLSDIEDITPSGKVLRKYDDLDSIRFKSRASKKVTAENMTLDDIEAEDNKDQVQEEIEKIDETPAEDIFSETTPEQYFDKALQEDKVDTINDVVSKCIDKFSEKFKDFDKYQVKILSYNTKVLEDDKPVQEEMVEDKELNANAILQVILQITNNAEEENIKKALAVFSITNGELHWTGTVRGENDQVVAFTEEGLDSLFEVDEPSEEELEDII